MYYAGGYATSNENFYIAENATSGSSDWWTMTPGGWSPSLWPNDNANVFIVGASESAGQLQMMTVTFYSAVRPVISLISCVTVASGNGTSSNPYTVSVNSSCSNAEN